MLTLSSEEKLLSGILSKKLNIPTENIFISNGYTETIKAIYHYDHVLEG